jgi:hypothetical protein
MVFKCVGFVSRHGERDVKLPEHRERLLQNALNDLVSDSDVLAIYRTFGYHHFLTYKTYSVNETLEYKEKESYHIDEIALFSHISKEEYKRIETLPWYYKMHWLPWTWRENIAKVDQFFSFPYDKSGSGVILKGVLSGGYPEIQDISITVNNKERKLKEFTTHYSVGDDPSGFVVALTFDEKIKPLHSLRLRIEDTAIKWDNLDEKEETHYFLSPFYSQREYIVDRKH